MRFLPAEEMVLVRLVVRLPFLADPDAPGVLSFSKRLLLGGLL